MENNPAFRWSDYDEWLCPFHLAGHSSILATINKITVEQIFNPHRKKKEPCPVLHLQSALPIVCKKPLPMSATRRKQIASLFGDNPSEAIGKQICLKVIPSTRGNDMIAIFAPRGGPDWNEPEYMPIADGDETPAESIGYRHQAETEAEIHNRPPVDPPTFHGAGVQVPSVTNGHSLPATTRIVQTAILDFAAKNDWPHLAGDLPTLLRVACDNGFTDKRVTMENIEAFKNFLDVGMTPKESEVGE